MTDSARDQRQHDNDALSTDAELAEMNRQLSADERDAHQAGADTAAAVIAMQVQAGMPVDRIERSADRVLAGRTANPTPASTAFYDAYADVAYTYSAAARMFPLHQAEPEAEAG